MLAPVVDNIMIYERRKIEGATIFNIKYNDVNYSKFFFKLQYVLCSLFSCHHLRSVTQPMKRTAPSGTSEEIVRNYTIM